MVLFIQLTYMYYIWLHIVIYFYNICVYIKNPNLTLVETLPFRFNDGSSSKNMDDNLYAISVILEVNMNIFISMEFSLSYSTFVLSFYLFGNARIH